MGWPTLFIGPIAGFLADLIFRAGNYSSWKHTLVGYFVFSLWIFEQVDGTALTPLVFAVIVLAFPAAIGAAAARLIL